MRIRPKVGYTYQKVFVVPLQVLVTSDRPLQEVDAQRVADVVAESTTLVKQVADGPTYEISVAPEGGVRQVFSETDLKKLQTLERMFNTLDDDHNRLRMRVEAAEKNIEVLADRLPPEIR